MCAVIWGLLDGWLQQYSQRRMNNQKIRKLTILVLTNGLWTGIDPRKSFKKTIIDFQDRLRGVLGTDLHDRIVSIELISFGNDPDALYNMRYLDNDFAEEESIDDMIDTEPWDGCIYQMLLGSFVPDLDNRNDGKDDASDVPPSTNDKKSSRDRFSIAASHQGHEQDKS
ncbi:hypothetical protein LTR66_016504, partial [Elasticomyces elasticus]